MKILVATDDRTFNYDLCAAYLDLGFEVHTGLANFFLRQQDFDLIHCHWPEELAGWRSTDRQAAAQAISCLDWWRPRTKLVCTAHNLLPHYGSADDTSRRLYQDFFGRMDRIGHFTHTSKAALQEAFADIPADKHFVHGMNLFSGLRRYSTGREAARSSLGISADRYVVATVGQLRTPAETRLIQGGLSALRGTKPLILFASRLPPRRQPLDAWQSHRFAHWCRGREIRMFADYLDDETLVQIVEAADAIVIPRFGRHLNSGLLPLAMTFATPVVAPDYGIYRELLQGSQNELYAPASSAALAASLEALARKPPEKIRAANRALSRDWGWENVVRHVLEQTGIAAARP